MSLAISIASMFTLDGRKIAVLENRHRDEVATLVERLGGVPVVAPAVNEVACHDDFRIFMDGLVERRFSLAIFLSGAGPSMLLREAERRGRLADARAALRQLTIACRGAKPLSTIKEYGLKAQITTAKPHTTQELIRALESIDVINRGVVLVHYGERNIDIAERLRARGARLKEICPYEWMLPQDLGPISNVVRDAIAHRLDAMLFTNRVQYRHLFQVAAAMGQAEGLVLSLNRQVVVGAVGPVCASALERAGVSPDVVPHAANIPSLISAVAEYFEADTAPAR